MIRTRLYIAFTFLFGSLIFIKSANGQAELNKPVIMTGGTDAEKQVKNISNVTLPNDAVNVLTIQKNNIKYSNALGGDSIFFNVVPSLETYSPGLTLYFKTSLNNTGPVVLNINNLGPIFIKKNVNMDLAANDIQSGEVNAVIFDGSSFQLINERTKVCPTGFTEANSRLCIETNERTAQTFFNAVITCYSINARICTWGEWYYACQKASLSLVNMTNNFEWCDSATNESGLVRISGSGSCTTLGQGTALTSLYSFRCCFSK